MKTYNKLLLLTFCSLQLLCMISGDPCHSAGCKYVLNSNRINFPFRIKGVQPASCGYPGFDVYCNDTLGVLIDLPSGESFVVDTIYYGYRAVRLSDPDKCLPRRFMSLDFNKISPFGAAGYNMYALYNCTGDRDSSDDQHLLYDYIDCLSGPGYSVLSVTEDKYISDPNCRFIQYLPTPNDYNYLSNFAQFTLYWPEIDSSAYSDFKKENLAAIIFVAVTFSSFLLLSYAYHVYLHWNTRRNQSANANGITINPTTISELSANVNRSASIPTTVPGLDQITIDSYPVTVIGDGRDQITPDNVCPICLSEYLPQETLKKLPECLHSFHADCIDEWLRSKASCPMCRVSPPSSSLSDNCC